MSTKKEKKLTLSNKTYILMKIKRLKINKYTHISTNVKIPLKEVINLSLCLSKIPTRIQFIISKLYTHFNVTYTEKIIYSDKNLNNFTYLFQNHHN